MMGLDFNSLPPALQKRITDQLHAASHAKAHNPRTPAIMERAAGNAALGAGESEKGDSGRIHIRFVSVRKRLLDPDNLSEKWLLDCLRNCGAIEGDEPEKIVLETTQRKVAKGEEEKTEITVTFPFDTPT